MRTKFYDKIAEIILNERLENDEISIMTDKLISELVARGVGIVELNLVMESIRAQLNNILALEKPGTFFSNYTYNGISWQVLEKDLIKAINKNKILNK